VTGAEPQPRVWTPQAISSDQYESSPAFTPDGREMFFMRSDRSFQNYRLMGSRCVRGRWTAPVPPPFAAPGPVLEADPFVTADGRRVYFVSARDRGDDLDIWYAERDAKGGWLPPRRLPEPVSSPGAELLPRLTRSRRHLAAEVRQGARLMAALAARRQSHQMKSTCAQSFFVSVAKRLAS
jgi:hypothetical protein